MWKLTQEILKAFSLDEAKDFLESAKKIAKEKWMESSSVVKEIIKDIEDYIKEKQPKSNIVEKDLDELFNWASDSLSDFLKSLNDFVESLQDEDKESSEDLPKDSFYKSPQQKFMCENIYTDWESLMIFDGNTVLHSTPDDEDSLVWFGTWPNISLDSLKSQCRLINQNEIKVKKYSELKPWDVFMFETSKASVCLSNINFVSSKDDEVQSDFYITDSLVSSTMRPIHRAKDDLVYYV